MLWLFGVLGDVDVVAGAVAEIATDAVVCCGNMLVEPTIQYLSFSPYW